MNLTGKLHAESPIYRGNARKTLFTRDGDGKQRLVSLAGEIAGTAQSLMDAFIGSDKRGQNRGLLNRLWERLYGESLPSGLIRRVDCTLDKEFYPDDHFFDLRMGIKLDEDRWAAEANANYKYETLYRNSIFDFMMDVDDRELKKNNNQAKLYYLLEELRAGRFWFGAGKSKGLGRTRLEIDLPFGPGENLPQARAEASHLQISLVFDAINPVLVGWNWGKVDPDVPAFAAVEGRLLVGAMRELPVAIRERLEMGLAGPILNPEDWKRKFTQSLPRVIAIWLRERSLGESVRWAIPASAVPGLTKGKYGLSKKVVESFTPLLDKPFDTEAALEAALVEALGEKANFAGRILKEAKKTRTTSHALDQPAWEDIAAGLGLEGGAPAELVGALGDEAALTGVLAGLCQPALPRLYEQVDQQINLLQSDAWVDVELASRQEHLQIKRMLLSGKITESDWNNSHRAPEGVSLAGWREFLDTHRRVRYHHMLHAQNLRKSITNDENFITFLRGYRGKTRQELAQPYNIDYRFGGTGNREVSKKYGKPYDTVFMRMLNWAPSGASEGSWEVYIPGSTLKGAFRKRAAQILKTLWGEGAKSGHLLDILFGKQGQVGLVFFSDAYLVDPLDPDQAWCSMDGIKMNPATGQPLESAKSDYLFAYGSQLQFQMRLDIQDVRADEQDAVYLLLHLLADFQRGDIPVGGEKTSGFGWVQAEIARINYLAGGKSSLTQKLFDNLPLERDGLWQRLTLEGETATAVLQAATPLPAQGKFFQNPPVAAGGFISHRAFGGHCGVLHVEAEVLTPLTIKESGEPSHTAVLEERPVNGWDFFSMSPSGVAFRPEERQYALPSKSIRGLLRHLYAITSNSAGESTSLAGLNPVDSLFGFVGKGPNQALTSRLSPSFGLFENPQLAWFKVPYPYGQWKYEGGQWERGTESGARKYQVAKTWRLFPHAPLAPVVQQLEAFQPDTPQASYFRAVLPGSRAHFTIRFWNLTDEELQRLVWCVALEEKLAHKMGGNRYLGFGSLRFHLTPESHLIDWASRYTGVPEESWKKPLAITPDRALIQNRQALHRLLHADGL